MQKAYTKTEGHKRKKSKVSESPRMVTQESYVLGRPGKKDILNHGNTSNLMYPIKHSEDKKELDAGSIE